MKLQVIIVQETKFGYSQNKHEETEDNFQVFEIKIGINTDITKYLTPIHR